LNSTNEKRKEIEEIDLKKDESSNSNFETESHEEEEETTSKKKRKRREQPEILRRSIRDKKVVEEDSEETEEEIFEVEAILLHKKFKQMVLPHKMESLHNEQSQHLGTNSKCTRFRKTFRRIQRKWFSTHNSLFTIFKKAS
jgi:hypothetical protein